MSFSPNPGFKEAHFTFLKRRIIGMNFRKNIYNYQNHQLFALQPPIKSLYDLMLHIVNSQFKALRKQTSSSYKIFKISSE